MLIQKDVFLKQTWIDLELNTIFSILAVFGCYNQHY